MAASEAITPSPGTMRLRAATISARRASTASSNSGIKTGIEPLRRFMSCQYSRKRPAVPRGRPAILTVDTKRSGRLNGCGTNLGRMGRDRHDRRKGELIMRTVIVAAALIAASACTASAQDVAKGEISFHKCLPCHSIGDDAQNKIGPELNGIDGRHSGSVADFSYSDANKNSGIVWNEAEFKDYIKDPRAKIPGTKMIFAGIKNEQEVSDLWAYVSQFNADGSIKKK